VAVDDIPETGQHIELAPDEAVSSVVAELAGVLGMPRLQASFDLTRPGADALRVVGTVSATVEQICVVTLEPMQSEVEEVIDLLFTAGPVAGDAPAQPHDAAANEPPEPLQDGVVDLGAVATEFLLLGIDPYPRKPDAVFAPPAAREPAGGAFAALAALKSGDGKKDR
jgi:uncharacterized metal-binding protein YceD (DUF177 family)